MKISEFIKELKLLKEREGDVELLIASTNESWRDVLIFDGRFVFERVETLDRPEAVLLSPSSVEGSEILK